MLTEAGSRLHVRLTANQGIGLHAKSQDQGLQQLREGQAGDVGGLEPVELLSGFVSYEQMADAMDSNMRGFLNLRKQEDALLSLRGPGNMPAPTDLS